jgi:hypothetical protein
VRRIAWTVAVACLGCAVVDTPSQAQTQVDPNMVCPDMFVPFPSMIAPPGADKNGNFIVCVKEEDSHLIWRDDLLMP